jgi:hypothetical protein
MKRRFDTENVPIGLLVHELHTAPPFQKYPRKYPRDSKRVAQALTSACEHIFQNKSDRRLPHMYPKHVGHENGGCGHLGRAPLSPPTFGGHSCKKDCMVAPHESRLIWSKILIL